MLKYDVCGDGDGEDGLAISTVHMDKGVRVRANLLEYIFIESNTLTHTWNVRSTFFTVLPVTLSIINDTAFHSVVLIFYYVDIHTPWPSNTTNEM